ncbi:MAG: ROK family protein [Rhodobiaceae bacterium]|nr:ROK family protein [Rhodobiaceae bacterium]MCC0041801.1 ROK family protein [Rhodobiaceae bacterium]
MAAGEAARDRLVGVDLGGTKISAVVLDSTGSELARRRIATPRDDYAATLAAIVRLVTDVEAAAGCTPDKARPVGIGTPGSLVPATGLVQNANSVWLNGNPLLRDLEAALGRRVRIANDADCLALSECADGAANGLDNVFAAILGTGVGGGLVIGGRLVAGPLGIAGEWGHTPLPWSRPDEYPGPRCWCGRTGCIEAWLSGPALARDHAAESGELSDAMAIARADTPARAASMERYLSRLARALAALVNIVDPQAIVLGGGLSNVVALCVRLPALVAPHVFSDAPRVRIMRAAHGDDSGVRGAARLWSRT